tara:strand:+ start:759 stop:1145 length:387 start_codon:yes stop_codon:yes gene_type:complete
MNWKEQLKKEDNKFVIYLRSDSRESNWQKVPLTFNSRDEALERVKRDTKKDGYTVVGNAKEGEAVIMDDRIFVNVMHPTLYYVIMMKDESPPSSNYLPDTLEANTRDAKVRQMGGDYSLSEKWYDSIR